MVAQLFMGCWSFLRDKKKFILIVILVTIALMGIALIIGKIYQNLDRDENRGAIPIDGGEFGESYTTPVYLEQGWSRADSLWFYNITQGSNLLPYDFFLSLEVENSNMLITDNKVFDKYRYLPQKPTLFNPDGLAVGFVKDSYQGKDYVGYTCAACHTSQVNFDKAAIRIDGGPAMADMVGYLTALQKALEQTLAEPQKYKRFVEKVLDINNDYDKESEVKTDLEYWTNFMVQYNIINHSHVDYGYARLDAFGRIYNRVLKHVPNKQNVKDILSQIVTPSGRYLLDDDQVNNVMKGIDETIIGDDQFNLIVERLMSNAPGYPGLSIKEIFRVRDALFNEPNAPVSYPFLWDIPQSDYVQWNGVAANAGVGPLGRNTGEVIGVFAQLDWTASDPWFSLSAQLSGLKNKKKKIDFKSSVDLTNLKRIESHLGSLQSPLWPEGILGKLDDEKKAKGRKIYGRYCQSCHELIDRDSADRRVVANFTALDRINTDPAMAMNSVSYKGKSGNFKHIYQGTDAGTVLVGEEAPVVQLLTAATTGVVATPDADKLFIRRWLDWLYTVVSAFFDNPIQKSIKAGNYDPDTTASPYQSLVSYKARPLNGIWATAPYLHNGSVPTLYDLLLPKKREGDPEDGEYRPDEFLIGSRQFDIEKVGFISEGFDGFRFLADRRGNFNGGHEYAAGKTEQMNGKVLPPLTKQERMYLLEFLKSL